jgi:hypothetical protein
MQNQSGGIATPGASSGVTHPKDAACLYERLILD